MNTTIKNAARRGLELSKPFFKYAFDATSMDLRGVQWRLSCASMVSAIAVTRNGHCTNRLLDLGSSLISRTRQTTVQALSERGAPQWAGHWPGEHYRLLKALIEEIQPRTIVEIGTYTGLGSLALLESLPPEGHLTTFDIVPWDRILEAQSGPDRENTYLRSSDFGDRRLTQIITDLGDPKAAKAHAGLFQKADLIFVDGPKDGIFERKFLDNCAGMPLRPGTILVFDDIRLLNMIDIWSGITHPKLDFTGFGHFTGTGLVEWS
jgi:predicted O-methyltransferase YrrM